MLKKLVLSLAIALSVSGAMAYDLCPAMSEDSCYALNGYYEVDFGTCCFDQIERTQSAKNTFEVIFVNDEAAIPTHCELSLNHKFCVSQGGYPVGNLCCYDF